MKKLVLLLAVLLPLAVLAQKTPVDKLFEKYANQKGFANKDEISVDVLRCTEAVLLHSGYNSVPRRKMLWESKPDCRNELVTNAVRRREVDAMLRSLHFRDNTQIDSDNYYKVRPIFDNLNKSISWFKDNEKFISLLF